MYLMVKEIVVPISDLRFMSVECSGCHTSVSIDMIYTPPPPPNPERLMPFQQDPEPNIFQCPVCHAMFDSRVADSIKAFRKIYRDLVDHKIEISFRVQRGWEYSLRTIEYSRQHGI